MKTWLNRLEILFLVVFGFIFVGAKIHFFTRACKVGVGGYLEEHLAFWAALTFVAGILALLDWIITRTQRRTSA